MGKETKTNAMRFLEKNKVPYTAHEYPHEEGVAVDGVHVAESMGQPPACVFKTLVTKGAGGSYFVFDIPVAEELDLKAAARAVGEKSVAMLHVADINKVTGYVRGGCSPVGMKKQFVTVFDESALAQEKIYVSGGRIGTQVCCEPAALIRAVRGKTAPITMPHTTA
ncbi:MAG: Cys-tRNA(Pro) deacylase [Faecalibacterium sp.]|jgi:Cys-tRNA(Pro)/Cys-tRNA(Cys) deacylase|nr:Cys-tRNA(Pro) deacylase [Faecalibacterium sp.]